MLEDGTGDIANYSFTGFLSEIKTMLGRFLNPIIKNSLLHKFYSHPTIKYLGEDKIYSKPSFLHSHNFSQTIIHLLRGEGYDGKTSSESELLRKALFEDKLNINSDTLRNLKHLFADARQDTFLFKNKLEDWYEEMMERASGWYKKQTQTILLIIGFGIAAAFNVDAIAISKILMKDKKVREQMVQLAISKQEQYGALVDSTQKVKIIKTEIKNGDTSIISFDSVIKAPLKDEFLEKTYNELADDAGNVMGILGLKGLANKSDTGSCKMAISYFDSLIKNAKDDVSRERWRNTKIKAMKDCLAGMKSKSPYQKSWFLVFVGWLLTALAISLGAPFWFDLLNKFVKMRESGNRPANTALQDKPTGTADGGNAIKGSDGGQVTG